MKLSAVFARYLYQHKTLHLPGIGVFSINQTTTVPDQTDKNYSEFSQQIRFEQKSVTTADEALINFIRTETGKIKPLAESDLESFLSDGKILLNIGKPFYLEGIGSLMKGKNGVFQFTPGNLQTPKLEGFYNETSHDNQVKKKPAYTDGSVQGGASRKLLIAAAAIGGVILIVWGGYSLYNRNVANNGAEPMPGAVSTAPVDTPSRANIILDSVKKIIDSSKAGLPQGTTGNYRFVIERTANKVRALKRFQQLKDNRADIKMETADSVLFSLYLSIPATPADTARIRDSLKTWYARKQVFVQPD